jgi:hypothetical protein
VVVSGLPLGSRVPCVLRCNYKRCTTSSTASFLPPPYPYQHQQQRTSPKANSFSDDCLPPEREYDSREALYTSINEWARTRGYAFSVKRSAKEKSGKTTVTFACDQACRPPTLGERRRKTATRGTNCPFSVLAKESLNGTWTPRHRPDRRFSVHNHEPSQHPSAHPVHRQLPSKRLRKARLQHSRAMELPRKTSRLSCGKVAL